MFGDVVKCLSPTVIIIEKYKNLIFRLISMAAAVAWWYVFQCHSCKKKRMGSSSILKTKCFYNVYHSLSYVIIELWRSAYCTYIYFYIYAATDNCKNFLDDDSLNIDVPFIYLFVLCTSLHRNRIGNDSIGNIAADFTTIFDVSPNEKNL